MSEDNGHKDDQICCSFCGKSQSEVKKLVAGRGVYICDECIDVCISIVHDEMNEMEKKTAAKKAPAAPWKTADAVENKGIPRSVRDRAGACQKSAFGGGLQPLQTFKQQS